jgi:uncharacterized cupin superfamily protein
MKSIVALTRAGKPVPRTPIHRASLNGDDPFARVRQIVWQGERDLAVDHVAWQGALRSTQYPHTELLIVLEGELLLTHGAEVLRTIAGEAILIPRGVTLSIQADAPVQWSYCAVIAGTVNDTAGLQRMNFNTPLSPSAPPTAAVLQSEEPDCRSGGIYSDDSTSTRIGVWDSTPYIRKQVPHRLNELMYLLAGSVTLTDSQGVTHTFNQGDIVFVPQGTPCAWHSAEMVKKLYWVQEA